jgi:hypothetical protein
MTTEYIRATISEYFRVGFGATAEVQYENQDTIDPSIRTQPYVALSLKLTINEQVSLGTSPLTRQRGAVQVDIYVKKGTGSKAAYIIADSVVALFMRQSVSGIEFQTPNTLSMLEVSGWSRLTVRAPFYYDY